MEKIYLEKLAILKSISAEMPKTRMMSLAKINSFIALNMRYEKIMLDKNLPEHPYLLVDGLVDDAVRALHSWADIAFIESDDANLTDTRPDAIEDMHQALFQQLWTRFSAADYQDRIDRYLRRLDVNGLGREFSGGRCIDFGCGHGNFAHALLARGAGSVVGVDFGEDSIRYAEKVRDSLGVGEDRIRFKLASVYDTEEPADSYDFAIQNGVFHHLDREDDAYREVHRVLKPGAWFWVYTDGEGGISYDLWDSCREALRDVPPKLIIEHLGYLNIATGKRYHLGDGLNAVYRHTNFDALTARLASLGFGNFRRLVGGFPTDFDHDVIAADPYGKAKFGAGDLRLLCQKI